MTMAKVAGQDLSILGKRHHHERLTKRLGRGLDKQDPRRRNSRGPSAVLSSGLGAHLQTRSWDQAQHQPTRPPDRDRGEIKAGLGRRVWPRTDQSSGS